MTEKESRSKRISKALWPRKDKAVHLPQDKAIHLDREKDTK